MASNPLNSKNRSLYFWLVVLALAAVQAFAVNHYYGQALFSSILDASIHWLLLGGFTYGLINTLAFYFPEKAQTAALLLAPIFLTGLWAVISFWLLQWVLQMNLVPSNHYLSWFATTRTYRITVGFLIFLAAAGFAILWYKISAKTDADKREQELESLKRDAELFKLKQQLQPHFLFNSLNSVIALIGSRPNEARDMTQKLSQFFRGTVQRGDQKLMPLSDELEHLKLYLEIEQVRFGHRLKVNSQIEELSLPCKLSPLVLQPLLENAIKFGLYGTTGPIEIQMQSALSQNVLQVEITNPFDKEYKPQAGTGFGLKSVNRRLYLIYGRTDLLKADSKQNSFKITLRIPQSHV